MPEPTPDFFRILQVLQQYRVDFIVVGGVCAVLQGAPLATFDLDIVHLRTPENVDRTLVALEALDAHYRGRAGKIVRPTSSHLLSPGHQLLMTSAGPLDLLGEIGKGHGYEELISRSYHMDVGKEESLLRHPHALALRILDLKALIEIKEETGRDKDQAVLAVLRRTLEEKHRPK